MGEYRFIEIVLDDGPSFIKDGPYCTCGYNEWIIKPHSAVCSHCGEELEGHFTAYVKDGPYCKCGYNEWFTSSDHWVCTHCGRSR